MLCHFLPPHSLFSYNNRWLPEQGSNLQMTVSKTVVLPFHHPAIYIKGIVFIDFKYILRTIMVTIFTIPFIVTCGVLTIIIYTFCCRLLLFIRFWFSEKGSETENLFRCIYSHFSHFGGLIKTPLTQVNVLSVVMPYTTLELCYFHSISISPFYVIYIFTKSVVNI